MSSVHQFNATDYDDALLRLIDLAVNNNVIAAAINAGGSGYAIGDILTVTGGTVVSSLTATLEVTNVAAGVVTGIRVFNCGAYSSNPGNPVSVTGGGGTLATFNLTFSTQNWTVNRNVASSASGIRYDTIAGGGGVQVLEREVQLQGPGNAGTDEIYVGIMEVRDTGSGSFNWAIAGFTGYGAGLDWDEQPGFSHISPDEIAAFTPLSNGGIECWFHVTPRHLKGICRIGSTYNNFYAGFINTFGTPAEYPYPLCIAGCSTKWNELFSSSGVRQSGLIDPGAFTGTGGNTQGPLGLRFFDGAWQGFDNWTFNGTSRTRRSFKVIAPCGIIKADQTEIPFPDRLASGSDNAEWNAIIPQIGSPGSPTTSLFPADDSAGDQTVLFPNVMQTVFPSLQIIGELDSVFWGSTLGNNIVSQDRVIIGGIYYRAFQNCNRTDSFSYVFLREDA
jgi:hypothetical protein